MFQLYSPEFRTYVEGLFLERDYAAVDVPAMFEQGDRFFNQSRFPEAALAYEAALQIEKAPQLRGVTGALLAGAIGSRDPYG